MLNGMKATDETGHAAKFTVSVPSDLFARGERERARQRISRSEFVARLYQKYLDEIEEEQRIARYRAAYAKAPETPAERVLTEASTSLLADEDRA